MGFELRSYDGITLLLLLQYEIEAEIVSLTNT